MHDINPHSDPLAPLRLAAGGAGLPQGAPPPDPGPLPPEQPAGINWKFARSRALVAGIILLLLLIIPVSSAFFPIWVPLCGGLAVFLYQKRFPATPISAGNGARMGLSAAVIGFLIACVLFAIAAVATHFGAHKSVLALIRDQFTQALKANPAAAQSPDLLNNIMSDGGLIALTGFAAVVTFVVFAVLGAIGGAIQSRIIKPTGAR